MTTATARYGFRVVGDLRGERRLVNPAAAFAAHCSADPKAQPDRECYLSAFRFVDDFRTHMNANGTPRGYAGSSWSPHLWYDIDREDLAVALADTRRLVTFLLHRYPDFAEDDLLYFYSGRKGGHVGVPLAHAPAPSPVFHRVCRELAQMNATGAGVAIDPSIYTLVQPFRAPNSLHPKTGLHKRRLTHAELMNLSLDKVRELAAAPSGFAVPTVTANPPALADDWRRSEIAVAEQQAARPTGHTAPPGRLTRSTLDFIREGAEVGERHVRLFRAAANLREFDAPPELVHALLAQAALDCALSPDDVRRQIDGGIAHADQQAAARGGAA